MGRLMVVSMDDLGLVDASDFYFACTMGFRTGVGRAAFEISHK